MKALARTETQNTPNKNATTQTKKKVQECRRWIPESNSTHHWFFGIVWSEDSRCNIMRHPPLASWTFGQPIRHKGTAVQAKFQSFPKKATFLTKKMAFLWVHQVSIGFQGHTRRSHCSDLNSLLKKWWVRCWVTNSVKCALHKGHEIYCNKLNNIKKKAYLDTKEGEGEED